MKHSLPTDWQERPLGQILGRVELPVAVVADAEYREIGIRSHGKGIFHKEPVLGQTLGNKRVFRVQPGCLVFNIVFAWEGAVAVTSDSEEGMIGSHRFPMFAASDGRVDVEFLRRFFQTKRGVKLLGDASPGGAGRNRTLNQKFLSEIPVPVPPLPVQRKIAAILSSVDDAIEKTQAVIDQLQVVKKGLMHELLTRGLPGRHTRFKMTEIGEVPEEWAVLPLGALVTDLQYGTSTKCTTSPIGHPVLRIPNVVSTEVDLSDLKFAELPPAEVDKYRLTPGDLLVIRTNGNPNYVGRAAVVPPGDGVLLYASYLIRVRVDSTKLEPSFLHLALTLAASRRSMEKAIRTSAGNYNLNTQGIRRTMVVVPPLDEQLEVVTVLEAISRRARVEMVTARHLATLRSALMSVLLTGEVRVQPGGEVT